MVYLGMLCIVKRGQQHVLAGLSHHIAYRQHYCLSSECPVCMTKAVKSTDDLLFAASTSGPTIELTYKQ